MNNTLVNDTIKINPCNNYYIDSNGFRHYTKWVKMPKPK